MTDYGILLVAVRSQGHGRSLGQTKLRINPGIKHTIQSGDVGIFIAQGPAEVKRFVKQSSTEVSL